MSHAMHYLPTPEHTQRLTTDELRAHFHVSDLFRPGAVTLRFIDLDRVVLGGVVPLEQSLSLTAPDAMAAEYFTERREVGALNIGGAGHITVDGESFAVANRDVLYIGRGARDVTFVSDSAVTPARFYLVSYPAHAAYPTALVTRAMADVTELGAQDTANRRRLAKYIHPGGVSSAQLVMGVTDLLPGSVWNTMPTHTHARRSEVYLYFDVPHDAVVCHLMGEPANTKHLIMRDGDVALSPGWSIHSGCGTTNYGFCWAMGGENQAFADMQMVDMHTLR